MNTNRLTLIRGWAVALLLAATLLLPQAAAAYDFMVDGLCYNKTGPSTVEVTYERGTSYENPISTYDNLIGNLTIPESVVNEGVSYSVTAIGAEAFTNCSALVTVDMPATIQQIGYNAFCRCTGLTSVELPESLTFIDACAFESCSSLASMVIPNSVNSIESLAFAGCSGLTTLIIGNSVSFFPLGVFDGCTSLTSVTIGASVSMMNGLPFSGSPNLEYIKVDAGNTTYDSRDNCNAIIETVSNTLIRGCKNTTIPHTVTSIGDCAFASSKVLTSVTIPSTITSISSSAFNGCDELASIVVDAGNSRYDSRDNCNAIIETETNILVTGCKNTTIPNSVTSIGQSAFSGCSGMTSVTIPNSITSIGEGAFSGCSGLNSVNWNATKCSNFKNSGPFSGLSGITSFVFGEECERIPAFLCYNLTGLTSVDIPISIIYSGKSAFGGCTSLTTVRWNAKSCTSTESSFNGLSNITSFEFSDEIERIPSFCCNGLSGLQTVTIPNSVTSIGDYAFYDCSGMTSVTIGNSVTTIGGLSFYKCSSLTSVSIPGSVKSIGGWAFRNCSALERIDINDLRTWYEIDFGEAVFSGVKVYLNGVEIDLCDVTIPDGTTKIGQYAFAESNDLKTVRIPSSVTSIGDKAFMNCSNLETIYNNIASPSQVSLGSNVFYRLSECTLFVPTGTVELYRNASQWCDFPLIYDMADTTTVASAIVFDLTDENSVSKVMTKDGVTLAIDSNDYFDIFNNAVYIDGGRTLTLSSEQPISNIVFTIIGGNDLMTASVGNYASPVWTGLSEKVVFTQGTGQMPVTIKKVAVTLENSIEDFVFAPTFEPGSGTYFNSVNVEMRSKTENAEIHYTTDGTVPSAASATYIEPLDISQSMTINAIAIKGGKQSIVNTAEYVVEHTELVANIAEFKALDDNTVVKFANNLVVTAQKGVRLYVKDDSGSMYVYGDIGKTYGHGDIIPAGIMGKKSTYAGEPELAEPFEGFEESTESTTVEALEVETVDIAHEHFGDYVVVKMCTVSQNAIIDADGNVVPFSTLMGTYFPSDKTKTYDVYGIVGSFIQSGNIVYRLLITEFREIVPEIENLESIYTINSGVKARLNSDLVVIYQNGTNLYVKNNEYYGVISGPLTNSFENGAIIRDAIVSWNYDNGRKIIVPVDSTFVMSEMGAPVEPVEMSIEQIGKDKLFNYVSIKNAYLETTNYAGAYLINDQTSQAFLSNQFGIQIPDIWGGCPYDTKCFVSSDDFFGGICLYPVEVIVSESTGLVSNGGLNYLLNPNQGTAEVIQGDYSELTEADILPTVERDGKTYSVVEIADRAFQNCTSLTSVTIPNSVISIGSEAFGGCCGLTSVTIGNSVTSIGSGAFEGSRGLTSVTIPNSVTSIGEQAFYLCSGLESVVVQEGNTTYDSRNNCNAIIETATNTLIVGSNNSTIPNSVTSIGISAFENCGGLTSVIIPNSVTTIGYSAFYGCSGLTSVTIPNSVTFIGDWAFDGTPWLDNQPDGLVYAGLVAYKYKGTIPDGTTIEIREGTKSIAGHCFSPCYGLASVTIPNSVTSIGDGAFQYCSSLTSVTIPNSVLSIGEQAFKMCNNLTGELVIPNSVTIIGDGAFQYCSSLTSVIIGNSVTSIGMDTFSGCSGLTSVTIPNSVTSIGDYAFQGCSGLTSVTIPNSVTSIGMYAFSGCSGLASVTIGNSVTSIGDYAFQFCTSLTSVTIPNSVTEIGHFAFHGCSGLTGELIIPNSVTSIGNDAFHGCSGLTSLTIGNSVTSIGSWAFYYCTSLTSVTIGNSVTTIGELAFFGCSGLTTLTIPNSVTSIGNDAFHGCSGLISVFIGSDGSPISNKMSYNSHNNSIPLGFTTSGISIGSAVFSGCFSLSSVTIGKSVIAIGDSTFIGCGEVAQMISLSVNPPIATSMSFEGIDCGSCKLYVPAGSKSLYISAAGWKNFRNIIELDVIAPMRGDVNLDGAVDVADANIVVNILLGKDDAVNYDGRADLDCNGGIDVSDVNELVNIILGK